MLWLKKRKKAFCPTLKWRCGYNACAQCPQLSSPVHKRRHQQGSGLPIRVDFRYSHIVTTRYKDYCIVSASHNLKQGNECGLFIRLCRGIWWLDGGVKVLNVLYRCVIRVASEQLLFWVRCKTDWVVNFVRVSPNKKCKYGDRDGRQD